MIDRLSGMAVFAAVVDAEGFSEAARRLGLSKAAVSKQITRLEQRLGARLLQRTTRSLSMTEAGAAFYQRCQKILIEAELAESAVNSLAVQPQGTLRVSAPMSFGRTHVAPLIADFLAPYPELSLDLVLSDRYVDLVDEGFDLAIRIGDLSDSSLIAKRLAPTRMCLVASPIYLARAGQPTTIEALKRHQCLCYSYQRTGHVWRFMTRAGVRSIPIKGIFQANNGDVLRTAALGGLGIAMLPDFIVAADLAEGRLIALELDGRLADAGVYAAYPSQRQVAAKVRLFIDHLARAMGPVPPWDRLLGEGLAERELPAFAIPG